MQHDPAPSRMRTRSDTPAAPIVPAHGAGTTQTITLDGPAFGSPLTSPPPLPSALPPPLVLGIDQCRAQSKDEWLLTNGIGGFAMGTVSGIPDRRYHHWLIAAATPPVGRVAALQSCAEWLVILDKDDPTRVIAREDLSTYRFADPTNPAMHEGVESPRGVRSLVRFERGPVSCVWTYVLEPFGIAVTRELFLFREMNAVSVRYRIDGSCSGLDCGHRCELHVRPMLSMRDFHGLNGEESVGSGTGRFAVREHFSKKHFASVRALVRYGDRAQHHTLEIDLPRGEFRIDPQVWRNFFYTRERERGLGHTESLFSPGLFVCRRPEGEQRAAFELRAGFAMDIATLPRTGEAAARERDRLAGLCERIERRAPDERNTSSRSELAALTLAGDQFVVRRELLGASGTPVPGTTKHLTSIIAGYPWFGDWGRDTFIALPGLLLATGRHPEAFDTLRAFAQLRRRGLIPNSFDDSTGAPEYNTVDASLWFVHACCGFFAATKDEYLFNTYLRDACLDIIDHYQRGTDFGIAMDPRDGLLSAGDATTQLTWMDARRDGVVFTPRAGKAVEINALWHSVLRSLATILDRTDSTRAGGLRTLAQHAGAHFEGAFWCEARGCLWDVAPGGESHALAGKDDPHFEMRPNQIFALSLPHCPLSPRRMRPVLASVEKHLLTPEGLRTLQPTHPRYRPHCQGSLFDRDGAYHNGTVWPWLLGPFCEAMLRTEGFSEASRDRARSLLAPRVAALLGMETNRGPTPVSLRSAPEIHDAEPLPNTPPGTPRKSEGCPMQAWSVAELLRVWVLANEGTRK